MLANCIIALGFLIVNEFSKEQSSEGIKMAGASKHVATICCEIGFAAGEKKRVML